VPPGDENALADALVDLLADEERRQAFGVEGHRLVRERYSWDEIAQRLLRIYELVAGARAEPAAVPR
jgi:glycosyltransferase involved in cell wall biosynthesis